MYEFTHHWMSYSRRLRPNSRFSPYLPLLSTPWMTPSTPWASTSYRSTFPQTYDSLRSYSSGSPSPHRLVSTPLSDKNNRYNQYKNIIKVTSRKTITTFTHFFHTNGETLPEPTFFAELSSHDIDITVVAETALKLLVIKIAVQLAYILRKIISFVQSFSLHSL